MTSQSPPSGVMTTAPIAIDDNEKRRQIRKYYAKSPNLVWPIALIALGFLLTLPDGTRLFGLLMMLGGGAWLAIPMLNSSGRPDDRTIDAWLREDLSYLVPRALQRLNVEETQRAGDPLPIIGIALRSAESMGVPLNEHRVKKGKDGVLRFSVRAITILHLLEHKVSSYQCFYNTMRGVALHERDDEYYYRDIVSVSTTEDSTNYTLPNGVAMRHSQAFRMSVASGENITVIVSPLDVRGANDAAVMADSGADKAIKAVRKMLEEKKQR